MVAINDFLWASGDVVIAVRSYRIVPVNDRFVLLTDLDHTIEFIGGYDSLSDAVEALVYANETANS